MQKIIKDRGISHKFFFLGSFPPKKMPNFAFADALLITLKKADIFSYTIPGKLQSYLACGRPIIGSLDGIGNKIITNSKSGYASEAENEKLLADNILKIYNASKSQKEKLSSNAIKYFQENFSKDFLLDELENIFENH